MKALIPAAGLGTRFLPATKAQPKEMLPVLDKPAIQYVVEEGLASGADEVVVISNRSKTSIERHFSPDAALEGTLRAAGKHALAEAVSHAGALNVSFAYQDAPLGLGHAVRCAAAACGGEPFFVMLGDVVVPGNDICPRLLDVSRAHGGASVIAVVPVPDDEVSRFGIIAGSAVGDGVWRVDSLVEKPHRDEAPSNLAVFGRYLLSPRVMELLADAKPSVGGEIQLTDALDAVLAEEEMYAVVISPEQGYDTGTVESWVAANAAMLARRGDCA